MNTNYDQMVFFNKLHYPKIIACLLVILSFNYFLIADGVWKIHRDGSFDLVYNDLKLQNCYPALDGKPVKPVSVNIDKQQNGGVIQYDLAEGKLKLELGSEDASLFIKTKLEGRKIAPDRISPIAFAEIQGADKFYRQGFGFAGASGIYDLPQPQERMEIAKLKEDVWSYDSYLFTGLLSPDNSTIVISAYDHKDYQHRCTIYNRQHRYGLIDRHLDHNIVLFESGFATENIKLDNNAISLPKIYIKTGQEPFKVFRSQAEAMARFNNIGEMKPPRYYYCSWYEFHKDFSHKILSEMLQGIDSIDRKPEFQTIQIDDGYAPYGDWLDYNEEKFPKGIPGSVKAIKAHGYEAGIWVAPFMVSSRSFVYKEHKDWLLRDLAGKPIKEWEKEQEDVYVLDSSHPEAFAYLRKVFRTFRRLGIKTYKTDFMDWGLRDSKKVKRYRPGKTSVQYFVEVLEMIREEIGPESFWLGCISPYQPMVGFVDGMRLSNDVSANWSQYSTINMFNEMRAGQFFNNILWQNDPDVLYLRDYDSNLSQMEKHSIALYDGMIGGMLTTSCRFPTLTEEAIDLWKFLEPAEKPLMAKFHDWDNPSDLFVLQKDYRESKNKSILYLNISDQSRKIDNKIGELSNIEAAEIYKWKGGCMEKINRNEIKYELAPHACKLFYVSQDGKELKSLNKIKD